MPSLKLADTTVMTESGTGVVTVAGTNVTFPTGHILQVVQSVKSTTESWDGTGSLNWNDISDLSVDIIPKTGNKVLVLMDLNVGGKQDYQLIYQLLRGSTPIFIGTGGSLGSKNQVTFMQRMSADVRIHNLAGQFLDATPGGNGSTTITYKMQASGEATHTFFVNRSYSEGDNYSWGRTTSSITAMEVQA